MAAHLEQAARSAGVDVEDLVGERQYEIPEEADYVWNVYREVCRGRRVGFSIGPVPLTEIVAWQQLNGVELTPWEVGVLCQLDNVFLECWNARSR